MTELHLSIIVPYHQVDSALIELIDSILVQKSADFEMILISDRAPDLPENIKRHPQCVCSSLPKESRWAGSARNLGLSLAKGKFVLFADSDDVFRSDWYQIIMETVKDNVVDLYFFKPQAKRKDGKCSRRAEPYVFLIQEFLENGSDDILYRFHVPWSKVYRREFILKNEICFDEIIASNDVNFSLLCSLRQEGFVVSNQTFYCVIEHEGSLTQSITREKLESRVSAIKKYNSLVDSRRKLPVFNIIVKSIGLGASDFFYFLLMSLRENQPIFYSSRHLYKYFNRKIKNIMSA